MIISSNIFEAYLQCHTKCWQLSRGEAPGNNVYEEWIQTRNQAYLANGLLHLSRGLQPAEILADPSVNPNQKTILWRLASNVKVISKDLEARLHAVERTPPGGNKDVPNFVPIRFVARNKLTKLDKLLVAYDAHILAESLNLEITQGSIIHGERFSTLKVKTSVLTGEVRKLVDKIRSLLTGCVSPQLILNRHCQGCRYQSLCHEKAIKNDDLSLLGGMTEKERTKFNTKGIFTVTQLSYTFRPRKRPKMRNDKREKYHHSLKALSIREKKIHIVGNFELKIEGTPVYLDVEGLPDSEFYYLIGARIKHGDSVVQYSLWADRREDEERIWKDFVELLGTIENPVLIHYGSYETAFIKTMRNRYGVPETESDAEKTLSSAVNPLSVIFGRVYFPVPSNSLKEIAKYYCLDWSSENASGIYAIIWRDEWDNTKASNLKDRIVLYNSEDCMALNHVTDLLLNLNNSHENTVVNSEDLKPVEFYCKFQKNQFKLPELQEINIAAYWDYQRDKIQFGANYIKKIDKQANKMIRSKHKINNTIIIAKPEKCPRCCKKLLRKQHQSYNRTIYDIKFIKSGMKKWVTKYIVNVYGCSKCGKLITSNISAAGQHQYGYNIRLLTIYFNIDYQLTLNKLSCLYAQLLDYNIPRATLATFKANFASIYKGAYDAIFNKIINEVLVMYGY